MSVNRNVSVPVGRPAIMCTTNSYEKGEFEGAGYPLGAPQENLSHIFIRECARVGMGVCKVRKNHV